MAIQKKEVDFAKELDDVGALLVKVVSSVKEKKDAMTIAAEAIQPLIEAVAGIEQLDDEFIANRKVAMQTISARLAEITDMLLPKA